MAALPEHMALTASRIVILLASTLVLSLAGVACLFIGVHGPQVIAIIGAFLLLPNVILTRMGAPVGIPLMHSTGIVSILVFVLLQAAYYYALLWIFYRVRGRSRRKADGLA